MIGRPHVHLRRTGSTNERARELAAGGAPHGTLVTADEQTSGRGRQGRVWIAAPRSAVLMSVVLRHFGDTLHIGELRFDPPVLQRAQLAQIELTAFHRVPENLAGRRCIGRESCRRAGRQFGF